MDEACGRRERPGLFKRILSALRRKPRSEDRRLDEPPPDGGVREPRRPRPPGSSGTAVLERPLEP